ncbi:hypothetical protein PC128_g5903 [Phytophthora cactorum]|nr:hypothetical protein PC120_g16543 [Phytophthora cactorum]KAG3072595.1 hypothetical protein PC121_g8850 [Phytophthora cactorum]KAG3198608.1 hypothetical protein PC128_g5903 [Phytophthora cactorum]KAG4059154.1 hypothetical protein PC123_g5897 [Phytophthora cactorum]
MLKGCYTTLAGKRIKVFMMFSTREWLTKAKTLFGRAAQFAVMLSPWHLIVEKVPEKDVKFARLLQSTVTSFVKLEDSLDPVAPLSGRSNGPRVAVCMSTDGFVLSFDG